LPPAADFDGAVVGLDHESDPAAVARDTLGGHVAVAGDDDLGEGPSTTRSVPVSVSVPSIRTRTVAPSRRSGVTSRTQYRMSM